MNTEIFLDWLLCGGAGAVLVVLPSDPMMLAVKSILFGLLVSLAINVVP